MRGAYHAPTVLYRNGIYSKAITGAAQPVGRSSWRIA